MRFVTTNQTTQVPADFSLGTWNVCWPELQQALSPYVSLDLAICDCPYLLLLFPLLASRSESSSESEVVML